MKDQETSVRHHPSWFWHVLLLACRHPAEGCQCNPWLPTSPLRIRCRALQAETGFWQGKANQCWISDAVTSLAEAKPVRVPGHRSGENEFSVIPECGLFRWRVGDVQVRSGDRFLGLEKTVDPTDHHSRRQERPFHRVRCFSFQNR